MTDIEAKVERVFANLWSKYVSLNPEVEKIRDHFASLGTPVINDHIALRTFKHPKISKEVMAEEFIRLGYRVCESYRFEKKKLDAIHLEHSISDHLPKVFISELELEHLSEKAAAIVASVIEQIPDEATRADGFSYSGVLWDRISVDEYQLLLKESEYAAWVCAFGYTANHFTVKVNELSTFKSLSEVNSFLEEKGYLLNEVGGKIKGTPDVYLEQSSTLAHRLPVRFSDGTLEIPTVFYEFALRHRDSSGKEFSGFIADNADKIFESTNAS